MCTRAVPLRLPEHEAHAPEADLGDFANRAEQADLGEQVEQGCRVHRHCVRAFFLFFDTLRYFPLCAEAVGWCTEEGSKISKLVQQKLECPLNS